MLQKDMSDATIYPLLYIGSYKLYFSQRIKNHATFAKFKSNMKIL